MFSEKLKKNAPYNIFFTEISHAPETVNQMNSIRFTDLLCPSLGTLTSTLQLTFVLDTNWLIEQYENTGNETKPLTILYFSDLTDSEENSNTLPANVKTHLVELKDSSGIHHTKMGIYVYADGSIRIAIMSANLYYPDWNEFCQGVWVSPLCPALPHNKPNTAGRGPTNFKNSLKNYLRSYKVPCLKQWINIVERADFSNVKVFFVSSVPGTHRPESQGCHLHRVAELLSRYCTIPTDDDSSKGNDENWPILAQASSLGFYGNGPSDWIKKLLKSLASTKECPRPSDSNVKLCIIYPTEKNVLNSYMGPEGGGCLYYSNNIHNKQKWTESYYYQWKADNTHRTRAMPHIKTYCRISPCNKRLAYFLLTSANISRSAWGTSQKHTYNRSYEVGVLFLPSFFNEPYFVIERDENEERNLFPFIYDLPLTPYDSDDSPKCSEDIAVDSST